jgi:NAD(P)-dependent dehydrogenase (short-subunit alcohol dehydrogenase family)
VELRDRVVVVTGGGSGIGEALARAAAAAGARAVVVADLHGDEASRVAADIGGTGVALDVREEAAIVGLVAETEERHGPVDLFCSNAGIVSTGGVEEPDERIQAMWEIHVLSHIYAARAVLPSMIARGEGYLLNTASAAGLLTQIGSMAYSVTKHAAVGLAEWLSVSHHHQGIRVSVLCPQAVRTNLLANSPIDVGETEIGTSGPAGGDGVLEPADVAAACLEALREERFWVLPHPEVAVYHRRKAEDVDRWLAGMRRFQDRLYGGGPLPGDAIAP